MLEDARDRGQIHGRLAHAARTAVIDVLLAKGADKHARTTIGQSAYNVAEYDDDREAMEFLEARDFDRSPARFPELKGAYLGQKPPGRTSEVFAPGLVSGRYALHANVVFSPDRTEAFWSGRVSRLVNGRWTYPRRAVFGGLALEDVPCFHPDGQRLYDMARRPFPGGRDTQKENIWVWDKSPDGWTNPRPLDGAINDLPQHWQFSVDRAGNVYFATTIQGSSAADIYVSRLVNGRYAKPENLGPAINTAAEDEFPHVSPDASCLPFGRNEDIYVGFRQKDGRWGEAKPLGPEVNTPGMELLPTVSPDGKYLFYFGQGGVRPAVNAMSLHWQVSVSNSGTLCFGGRGDKDGYGSTDLYCSRLVSGEYTKPVNLGPAVNTKDSESQPFIAPDESFIPFYRAIGQIPTAYVSFKGRDGQWLPAVKFDLPWAPAGLMVSPDGKSLFTAARWKSAKFLDEIRRRAEADAPQQEAGRFTDSRDGRVYTTVRIAGKTWMAENLAYKTERGSWAYNDDPGTVTQYGYLYDWATAQAAAPKGWHVATVAEWAALSEHLGGGATASRKMRSTSGWSCGGTDSVGLAALPATARGVNGAFVAPPDRVIWWTATATTPDRAFYWEMSCSSFVGKAPTHRTVGLPVRCVRDG